MRSRWFIFYLHSNLRDLVFRDPKTAHHCLFWIHQRNDQINRVGIERALDVRFRRIRRRRGMRVIDRGEFPTALLDFAQRGEQRVRLGVVADARRRIVVGQRENLERAPTSAGDNAAGFVRRVTLRLGDKLRELRACKSHRTCWMTR